MRMLARGARYPSRNYTRVLALAAISILLASVFLPLQTADAALDFKVKKGSFTKSTAAAPASQSITGVGFQPKVVIFFWTRQTVEGTLAGIHSGYGFATGAANERAIAIASDDAVGTSNTGRSQSDTSCIIILSNGTPTVAAEAELTTFDSDGFTINWTTNEARADIIHYIALGGSELTNALASSFTVTSGAGTQSVTGLGFKPDFLMFISIDLTAAGSSTVGKASIGFASSPADEASVTVTLEDGRATTDTWVRQRTDSTFNELTNFGGNDMLADITSFDADGFTFNKSAADGTTMYYLALKGGGYRVGSFNKSTGVAPVSQSVTGVSFKPNGLILASKNLVTNTGIEAEGRISFGASDGTTEGATWFHDKDAVGTTDTNQRTSTSKVAVHASQSTLNAEADLTSFDADGFTINWTTNNAVAEEIIYVGFGDVKNLEETLSLADAVDAKLSTKSLSETLSLSDAISITLVQLSETLSLSDTIGTNKVVTYSATADSTAFGNERRMIQDQHGNLVAVITDSTTIRILYNNDPPTGVWTEATTVTGARSGGGASIAYDSTNDAVMLVYEDTSALTALQALALTFTKDASNDITAITVGSALTITVDNNARNPSLWRLHNGEFGLVVGDDSTSGGRHNDVHGCRIIFASPLTNAPTMQRYDGTQSECRKITGNYNSPQDGYSIVRPTLAQRTGSSNPNDIIVIFDYDSNTGSPFMIKIDWTTGPNWATVGTETSLTSFGTALNTMPTINYDSTNGRIVFAEFDDVAQTSFDVAYIADTADTTETGIDPTALTSLLRENPSLVIDNGDYWIFYNRGSAPTDIYYIKNTAGSWGSETLFRDATNNSGAKRVNCELDGSSSRIDCIWTEEAATASDFDVLYGWLTLAVSSIQQIAETIAYSDTKENASSKNLSDTTSLSDIPVKDQTKVLTDTLAMTDPLSIVTGFIKNLNENLVMSDTSIRALSRKVDATLTMTDTVDRTISRVKDIADTVTLTDSVVSPVARVQDITDTLTMTDSITALKTTTLSDTLTMTDTIVTTVSRVQNISDTLTMTDTVDTTISRVKDIVDTLSLTDSVVTSVARVQNIADTLSLTDSIVSVVNRIQNISDTLTMTDSVVTPVDRVQILPDTYTLTDSIITTVDRVKDVADSITITDTVVTTVSRVQTVSDAVSLTDTVVTAINRIKDITDTLSMTDSITTPVNRVQVLSDTLSLTDTVATPVGRVKDIDDTLTMTDTVATPVNRIQNIADTLSLTDSVATPVGRVKDIADTLTMTDSVDTTISRVKDIVDTLSLTDSVVTSVNRIQNVSDTLSLTDSIVTTVGRVQTVSDTLTMTDSVVNSVVRVKDIADTLSLTDSVVNSVARVKDMADTITITDTVVTTISRVQTVSDAVSLTDTVVTEINRIKDITDTLSMTDTITTPVNRIQNIADTLSLTDSVATPVARVKDIDDTLTMTDSVATPVARVQTLSDNVTLTDSIINSVDRVKDITDTITLTDAVDTTIARVQNVSDTFSMTDNVVTVVGRIQDLSDTLSLTDSIVNSVDTVKDIADTITLTDSVVTDVNRVQTVTDIITLTDSIVATIGNVQTLSETLTMTDAIVTLVSKIQIVSDTLTMSDSIVTSGAIVQALSDTIAMTDNVVTTLNKVQAVSDTLTMTDAVVTLGAGVKDIADTLTLTDSIVTTVNKEQTLSDTLALSDDTAKSVAKLVSDVLSMSDSIPIGLTFSLTLTESLSLIDVVITQQGQAITVSETLSMSEDMQTILNLPSNVKNLAEILAFADDIRLTNNVPITTGSPVTAIFLGGEGVIGGGTITFSSVSTAGTLSVTPLSTGPASPSGSTLVGLGGSRLYLDIDTTAAFTGLVISVTYDDTGLTPAQENAATLQQFNGVSWEDITTSGDTFSNIVLGKTDSFAEFAVIFGEAQTTVDNKGGGRPRYEINDTMPPQVASHSFQPSEPVSGKELTVTADIIDDVGVEKAHLLYFVNSKELEFHSVQMQKHNSKYFIGTIPASDVRTVGLRYWIFAQDFGHNNIQSSLKYVDVEEAPPAKPEKPKLPAHVLEAIQSKQKPTKPTERLEVISMNSGNEIKAYPDKIIIRNTGNRTADDIRIILSSDIYKSFNLSHPAIKSIEPNGNVTVTFELNGSPNRDFMGDLVGYKGRLMVVAEHLSPIILPINIGSEESYYISNYMDKVASIAEQRYNKISLINSILSKQPKIQYNYEVTTSDGDSVITSPSDELVIRNLSDKELRNVRIYVSSAGHPFMLEQKNIRHLEANGQVSIKLIPRIDTAKYSPKDIKGELLIVPSNDKPIKIPIDIVGAERKDSADQIEVSALLGKDSIFTAADKIIIKNLGNRSLDSVRLILPSNLANVLTLSSDSFQHIEANSEVVVDLKFRKPGEHKMVLQYNYDGELIVVSEHNRHKVIPINIVWNEVSSDHFTIYARSSDADIERAKDVVAFLEANYQNVTSRFGEMKEKTKIYMTSSLEEFRLIADHGHSYYSFSDDVIFICACAEDVKGLAMKEFLYRITFNKYPSYTIKQKFLFDGENWLMDGIANYIAANMTTGQEMVNTQIESFKEKPASFIWYRSGSAEQYGAAYTFFEYLHEKYGDKVIDRTLYYLGSGMISNHRCDTLEECALLRAVYDANGMDINDKKHVLSFDTTGKEWEQYLQEKYDIGEDESKNR